MGIQERQNNYMMTAPIIYSMVQQSVIVRTCITQLKQEVYRRGYVWEKAFEAICNNCQKKHKRPVQECSRCQSTDLRIPDVKQLEFAEKFLEGYVNPSEQLFIDVLKELEDDLNTMDDEIYRGDPVTMFIYADEDGVKGTKGFTCLNHRSILATEPYATCETCGSDMKPVHFVNRANGEDQYFLEGEVLHFSKYSPSRLYGFSPVITLYIMSIQHTLRVECQEVFWLFKLETWIQ